MPTFILLTTLAILTVIGFYMGRSRAVATVSGRKPDLHSLPGYYGYYVAAWCGIPALAIYVLWTVLGPQVVEVMLVSGLSPEAQNLPPSRLGLLINCLLYTSPSPRD